MFIYDYIVFVSRPLIKLTDRLLLVGVILDEDVEKLLFMIDPETWDPSYEKGNFVLDLLKYSLNIMKMLFQRAKMSIVKVY